LSCCFVPSWLMQAGSTPSCATSFAIITGLSRALTLAGLRQPGCTRRPTGETAIRSVGGLELLDIHLSVGSTKTNGNALFLRTFLNKLYLVFFVGRHKVEDRDAEEFSRLVVRKLLGYL
jgi:hypothetical protein